MGLEATRGKAQGVCAVSLRADSISWQLHESLVTQAHRLSIHATNAI